MKDLNAVDLEGAMRQIEGTARNMGIDRRRLDVGGPHRSRPANTTRRS